MRRCAESSKKPILPESKVFWGGDFTKDTRGRVLPHKSGRHQMAKLSMIKPP
jgi:hypothetical protein